MKIINCGSLNIDYVYSVDHMVTKGETLSSSLLETFCGGKGLNQSIALRRSGMEVFHAGRVGKGTGELLLSALKEAGVNTDLITYGEEETGHAIIQRDKSGDNSILLFGGANRGITKEWIDALSEHFEEGDFLLLQNEISELPYLMEKAKERGMRIIFNPSPMDETVRACPLSLVDYFILNEIEAEGLCGESVSGGPEKVLAALSTRFPEAVIVLTLGEKGSMVWEKGKVLWQEIFRVPVVDTTAAGDTFTGYFFGSLLRGMSTKGALERAAKASAIAVGRKGAAPSIPEAGEVDK